jgi:two-component system chemotaxis response regulator CheY
VERLAVCLLFLKVCHGLNQYGSGRKVEGCWNNATEWNHMEERMPSAEKEFRILVIDDSPVSRKLVELPLLQKGYSLIFASTGTEAIELFEKHRPEVVITDWMLPDLTGKEICERIRASSKDPYTYIIVLTGQTSKDNLVEALALGADDYLTKPFHRGELLARVGVGARITELHRQLERKNKQWEQLALTDALTGLPNRRAIEDWASTQFSSAVRHGFPFWVVLADLDHFKQVNDSFGHDAGDAVLKKFASILKSSIRRGDLCGRLGGEEFLVVLTHTDKKNALGVIERIRMEVSSTPVTFDGCTLAVTASFGLAGLEGTQNASSFSKLKELADTALYSAKRGGRNRVELTPAHAY